MSPRRPRLHKPPRVRRRPGARQRGYDAEWEETRAKQLGLHPWCKACKDKGWLIAATNVDHVTPRRRFKIRENADRPENLQSLCHSHHSQKTKAGQ